MRTSLPQTIFTLSIDVDSVAATVDSRRATVMVDQLLEICHRRDVPATWTVAEPASSPLVERIVARDMGHAVAISGDASWIGSQAGRLRFSHELARRVTAARDCGCEVSTLVVRDTTLDGQHDLVVKHGISSVRQGVEGKPLGRGRLRPIGIAHGLWSISASHALPGRSSWWPGGGGRGVMRRAIDAAIAQGGLVHLVVDAWQMVARGGAAVRVLDRVLAHAEWRRRQDVLHVATLPGIVDRMAAQYRSAPARSILRAAA